MAKFESTQTLEERFFDKISPEPNTGCWLWHSALIKGYPSIWRDGKTVRATHVAYEIHTGRTFPRGKCACHRCDTPACVNPDHLFLGTHQENMDDMVSKGRRTVLHGERHGAAKLTDKEADQIRSGFPAAYKQVEIAWLYGIHQTTVSDIRRGRRRSG